MILYNFFKQYLILIVYYCNINYVNLTFILIFLKPQNYQIIRVLIISRKMVPYWNASKVIDIQDEIRTVDGLSFNELLKFTAKSSTIRSDKKNRETTEIQLSKNINRSQIIDKDINDAISETSGIALWNRDTLLRYGISVVHIVSYIKSNVLWTIVNRRHDLRILCRIFPSTIIKFLNLSFRIPRIYFRIEYIVSIYQFLVFEILF